MQNTEKENVEEIFNKYSQAVYKYLFCLTNNKDLAEDLTQETFAIAMDKIDSFKGKCKLSVWLCQIAKHLWYKQLRKKQKEKTISFEELNNELFSEENIDEIIYEHDEKLKLFKDIQKLDEPFKDVIYLKLSGNLNFVEIAEILGKTPNWVRVTFFRAKQKLKKENDDEKRI